MSPHTAHSVSAAEYASTVLGTRVEPQALPEALAASIASALSREEEIGAPRDVWGNWEGPEKSPGTGFYSASLDREIIAWGESSGIPRRSLWPGGASWAFCLSHDLDFVCRYARWRETIQRCLRFPRTGGFSRLARRCCGGLLRSAGGLRGDPWWCYEKWMELTRDVGAPSTWFIFPQHVSRPHRADAAYSYRERIRFGGRRVTVAEMLREIHAAGHEIGLHPSIHAARDARELENQRHQVEEAARCEVRSVRQHFLRWDAGVTPREQSKAGLKVDSTLGFNGGSGFRARTSYPFRLTPQGAAPGESMIEVPLQLMDIALFRADGVRCHNAGEAFAVCLRIMDEVRAVGGVLTVNWHPNSISDAVLMTVLKMVLKEAQRHQAWFATMSQVTAHWEQQMKSLSAP